MPSHPPETMFYDDDANYTLWRDLSRLFEDFSGEDETAWPERQERFKTVVIDVIAELIVNDRAGAGLAST